MTTKPPSSLAAGDVPQSDEENDDLQVDASDDVTVEASEEVTTEAAAAGLAAVPSETPLPLRVDDTVVTAPPTAAAPMVRPASAPTVLGIPLSSIPLPGVTAAVATPSPSPSIEIADEVDEDEEVTHLARPVNDEVTRPSITDEDEEETKVEATDPLINAAAADDDVATALAEQASVEREKALRRSSPSFPASAMPLEGNSGVEFSDPDDEEAVVGSQDVEEDVDDDDGSEAATANHNDAPTETSPLAAAITRRPPPGAPFGRIPSPTSSFGLSLSPAPLGQVPAPSSSPFGNSRLAPAAPATPFGARTTTGSSPVVQIPAPSAGTPLAPRTSKLFEKYSVPLGGLVALTMVPLVVGLFIGIAIGRPGASSVVAAAPAAVTAPAAAPLVQPVAAPAPQLPAAKQPETAIAEPPPAEEPPAPKPVVKRVAPRPQPHKVDPLASDEPPAPAPHVAARPAPKPQPPAAKPAIKKPTKAWVDPFAN